MKKILISIIAVVLVVVFLFGFIDKVEKDNTQNSESLVYSLDNFSTDLKKVTKLTKREQDIICATSRGLIEIDSNGKILPSLAESVEVRDGGIEYDFKIKEDIYWSNGDKITSQDIVEFFRQAILEEESEDIAALLDIYGAKEYRESGATFSKTVAINADENSIVIRLNHKNDDFLTELSKPQYRIRDNLLLWDSIDKNYQNLKYSGNYKIEYVQGDSVSLARSEQSDKSYVENIKFVKDDGEEIAMAAFEVGNRDIVINPPRGQLDRLKSEDRLVTMESDRGMYLAFNPNTSIPEVGRREIYRNIVKSMEEYKNSNSNLLVMAEGSYFRKDKENLDKLQARKVFMNTEQNWDEERVIQIIAEENTQNKEMCEWVKKWFSENSKQKISYKLLKREELNKISKEDKYDIILMENYNNPKGDSQFYVKAETYLPKDLLSQLSGEATKEDFYKMEDTLFNSCIVLPLVFFNDNIAINNKVKNVSLDGNGNMDFSKVNK